MTRSPSEADAPPRGPEAVREALVQAAATLYASGEPFSARRVAREAGVNHGQVHHLFGGKAGLKRAMLERLADAQAAALPDDAPLEDLLRAAALIGLADPRVARVLARVLLEQGDGEALPQQRFPVVQRVRDALDAADAPVDPTTLSAGLAAALGLAMFGPWIRAAVGAPVDPAALMTLLGDQLQILRSEQDG